MRELPEIVRNYVLRLAAEKCLAAYLRVDRESRLLSAGGELGRYGLEGLEAGTPVCERAYFLVGLLPAEPRPTVMPKIEVAPSVFADVHVFTDQEDACILLLDSTAEVAERTQIEQALRQAEDHLRQAERMEAVGRLAGGIAHDFNNLLTAIMGYGELIRGDADQDDLICERLGEIQKAADRGAVLVRQLLAFSRRQVVQPSILDLNEVIMDSVAMLKRIVGEDVHFEMRLEPRLGRIKADRSQMQQVVLNLAVNARDAMPRGGRLAIETSNLKLKGASQPGSDKVVLRVADNGIGMDDETRARIFEPFFTTKEKGSGTGLGLSTVYGIVTACGGEIRVSSRPGIGTEFEIHIPRSTEKPVLDQAAPAEKVGGSRSETVLLVEDDDMVHRLVSDLLTRLGYHLLEASSASEALKVSAGYAGRIDLLLTDVVMPHVSGTDLAKELRAERPGMKTLFMSGYSSENLVKASADLGAPLIQKPFTQSQLSKAIRAAIESGTAQGASAVSPS